MNHYQSWNLRNLNPVLVILAINILVFVIGNLADILNFNLFGYLALYSWPFFIERPWGIITSVFTHVQLFHLIANMITLYFFGNFLLKMVGSRYFISLYLIGGLVGSVFFVALSPIFREAIVPAVGASGAVFALGGALAILAPQIKVFIFPIPAPLPLWVAVLGGFVILSFMPMVAWDAHLGGLVVGLAGGWIFKRNRRYYF